MNSLRVESVVMPAANLGGENPLPMLKPRPSAMAGEGVDASVPSEDRKFFGYGIDAGWLPHRGQDDYDRTRVDREFAAIVLENEFLRATFLPEIGGRLWSLVHKPSNRDLLFANPVFQPGNLAVRGAWVTGGVEWNACVYGHAPHTCSPMFAAEVNDDRYGKVLRLYEWDRTRCVPFQLDFILPADSPVLLVRVRIVNPNDQTIPMYWWSNMAVETSADVRVLAPARIAYTYDYGGPTKAAAVPHQGTFDLTYPVNTRYGADYFFRIADGARAWITALDGNGRGLIQTSTARQTGRKLFAWGTEGGGDRWQDFLSTPGRRFCEIQAGLSRTQLECAPMAPQAQWEWIEAYGLLEADAAKVHGDDWDTAVDEVARRLEMMVSRSELENRLQQTQSLADRKPFRILHRGSGWGALERIRREQSGQPPFCGSALIFDEISLSEEQLPWLALLTEGALPDAEPDQEPGAWMVQSEWRTLLEASLGTPIGDHWLAHLHLGLMLFAEGDLQGASAAWECSIRLRPSGWAHRNLAVLERLGGRRLEALSNYTAAVRGLPQLRPLLVEYAEYLLELGLPEQVLRLIDTAPVHVRSHSRVQFIEAQAGLALQLPERCRHVLREEFELVDIREGETSLSDFWNELVRADLDFDELSAACRQHVQLQPGIPARLDFQVAPAPHFSLTAAASDDLRSNVFAGESASHARSDERSLRN